jgi:hypothetical protein
MTMLGRIQRESKWTARESDSARSSTPPLASVRGATEGGILKLVLALRGYDATNSALETKVNQA